MPVTYRIGDRVYTPDNNRIGKIAHFTKPNEASIEFEDGGENKKFSVAALRKVV